jgi:phosphatidylglycerophosphatase B
MLLIARRTAVGAALLLIMPAAIWISGWKWHPGLSAGTMKLLYWVTETVTQPWGIITHVILCAWFLWCLRFRLRAAIMLFLILAAAILVGQGMKTWIKAAFRSLVPLSSGWSRRSRCRSRNSTR